LLANQKRNEVITVMKKGTSLLLVSFVITFSRVSLAVDEKAMKFGFYVDREVASTYKILYNEALNKRISEIGNRIAQASGKTDMNYTFRVVNDPIINAYSAAGGYIYVNTGLLDIFETKDELAAILAHEIHHTNANHQMKFFRAAQQRKILGLFGGSLLAVGITAAQIYATGVPTLPAASSAYTGYDQVMQYINYAMSMKGMTEQTIDYTLRLGYAFGASMIIGYGKKRELEADAFAIRYTKKSGYDPNALISVFRKLASIRDQLRLNETNYISNLINAEPGLENRIKHAEDLILKTK